MPTHTNAHPHDILTEHQPRVTQRACLQARYRLECADSLHRTSLPVGHLATPLLFSTYRALRTHKLTLTHTYTRSNMHIHAPTCCATEHEPRVAQGACVQARCRLQSTDTLHRVPHAHGAASPSLSLGDVLTYTFTHLASTTSTFTRTHTHKRAHPPTHFYTEHESWVAQGACVQARCGLQSTDTLHRVPHAHGASPPPPPRSRRRCAHMNIYTPRTYSHTLRALMPTNLLMNARPPRTHNLTLTHSNMPIHAPTSIQSTSLGSRKGLRSSSLLATVYRHSS